MKTFNIIAPVFHGFYNTIWEPDTEQEESELLHGQELEFDNTAYQNAIGEAFCDALKEFLPELISEIKFIKITSPREYNFTNDKIECELSLSKTNLDSLGQLIYDNRAEFEEYLKENYTSFDGFISFISSDFEDWEEDTKKFTHFEDVRFLQGILEFALELEEIEQESFYDEVHFSDTNRAYHFCTVTEDETKYARKCSVTGHGMNQGFLMGDDTTICDDEKILTKYLRENIFENEEDILNENNEYIIAESYKRGEHFWTEWEVDEEYYFTARGEEVQTPLEGNDPAENLEYHSEGSDIEHEIWVNTETKERFHVPVEIVRDFKNKTSIDKK